MNFRRVIGVLSLVMILLPCWIVQVHARSVFGGQDTPRIRRPQDVDLIAHPMPARRSFGLSRQVHLHRSDLLGLQQVFGMIAQKGAMRDSRPERGLSSLRRGAQA